MKKIPVAILGATGMVGQKFVNCLRIIPGLKLWPERHRNARKVKTISGGDALDDASSLSSSIANMPVQSCTTYDLPCAVVFSGLDSSVAGEVEEAFARAGYIVISNSRNHRMDPTSPSDPRNQ